MNRLRPMLAGVLLVASALVAGCSALGYAQPQTFKERLAYAYSTHAAIQDAAASSLNAKEITSADARQVLKLADESRTVLDAARVANDAGDPRTAEGRLALATSILTQLQTYLRNKGGGP